MKTTVKDSCTKFTKEEILKKRKEPCVMCGYINEDNNHIIGYDKTDVDELLREYYKEGDVLCQDCLFK